jgi:hypothetical protein
MNEPWYEAQGPNTHEVRNKLLEIYVSPNGKYNLVSLTTIKKVINDVILIEEKTYCGFGSYRGYYTSTHHNLIKEINGKLQPIIEEIARNKINKFIMNCPWIQGMLYRPPTDAKPAGRSLQ